MGKAQKLYKKWLGKTPREARIHDVKTFLNYYFNGLWDHEGGSHIVVRCEELKAFSDYQPYGEISVPVKSGQKVKGFYINALIKANSRLVELRGKNDEKP